MYIHFNIENHRTFLDRFQSCQIFTTCKVLKDTKCKKKFCNLKTVHIHTKSKHFTTEKKATNKTKLSHGGTHERLRV